MIVSVNPQTLEEAGDLLRCGELVAFPTETVYGLGADARNSEAVRKIFAVKGRPTTHPVIVHLGGIDQLDAWAIDVPPAARLLAEHYWPGPLTLILIKHPHVLNEITGGQDSVGLRVPAHPVARALLQTFGSGIAAPSANRFGRISPTTAEHVQEELGSRVSMILDGGPCSVGVESTIVDFTGDRATLLRPGKVAPSEMVTTLGYAPEYVTRDGAVRAPGTLLTHYAPDTPVRRVPATSLTALVRGHSLKNERFAVLSRTLQPPPHSTAVWRRIDPTPEGYARELYAALRELDRLGLTEILIEAPPDALEWLAVNDRLAKASATR